MSARVLVTGAAGRVGTVVVRLLRKHGHTVRGLDLRPSEADESVTGSLTNPAAVAQATEGVDAIVHLAAVMRWDAEAEEAVFDHNVVATHRLLRAAREVRRLVFASSGEVYPERRPAYLPIDEQHPLRPDTPYGLTKLLGEEMVRQRMRAGMPAVIVRLAHTQAAEELLDPSSFFSGPRFFVGPRLRRLESEAPTPHVLEAIRRLRAVGATGDHLLLACDENDVPYKMGICDVRDTAAGIALALEHPNAEGGTFNIGPEAAADFGEIVPHMARLTGLPMARVRLPLAPYRYETSVQRAHDALGYRPRFTVFQMIEEAAAAWAARQASGAVPR